MTQYHSAYLAYQLTKRHSLHDSEKLAPVLADAQVDLNPHQLRQMSLNDPKLGLYREVKVIQEKLGDPQLTLNAFIVSGTNFPNLVNVTCKKK